MCSMYGFCCNLQPVRVLCSLQCPSHLLLTFAAAWKIDGYCGVASAHLARGVVLQVVVVGSDVHQPLALDVCHCADVVA